MSSNAQPALDVPLPVLTFDPEAAGVYVDLARMLAGRLLIQGSSGSGKSYALRYVIEQTADQLPFIVVDWEGEFPSLREVLPFVVVGSLDSGADLQASAATARATCRRLIGARMSVVLDLSDLPTDADDPGDRRRVAALWLDELMKVHDAMRYPRLVVIDEIQELCPQGEKVASSAAVKAVVARGRKRGLGIVAGTQRIAKLHKDAAEAQNLWIGLTTQDVDVDRAADILGFNRQRARTIEELHPGQFLVKGRAMPNGVTLARTGDVRSEHPDTRLVPIAPPSMAEIAAALAELRDAGETPAEDASRQELLETIERLARERDEARAGNVSEPKDIARAVDQATAPLNDTIRALRLQLERAKTHARLILLDAGEIPEEANARNDGERGEDAAREADDVSRVPTPPDQGAPADDAGGRGQSAAGPKRTPPQSGGSPRGEGEGGGGPNPLTRTFAAAIVAHLRGRGAVPRDELARAVGSKRTSSTFRSTLGALRKAGLVRYPKERQVELVEVTPA